MKAAERDALCKYIYEIQKRLRLADWTLLFVDEPAEPTEFSDGEPAASILKVYGRKWANLRVGPSWADFTPEQKRQYIVHELVHLHLEQIDDVIYYSARKHLPAKVWDVVRTEQMRAPEHAVDGLADVLAPLMPLPPEPKQRKTRRQEKENGN